MTWAQAINLFLLFMLVIGLLAIPSIMLVWYRRSVEHGLNPQHKQALRLVVEQFVLAAESVYRSEMGQKKKEWVLDEIEKYATRQGVKVDMGLVAAMLEAAVYQVINGPKGIKAEEIKTAIEVERTGGNPQSLPFIVGAGPALDGPPPVELDH